MRFTLFASVMILLGLSAGAQDRKKAPTQSSASVLVNGQPIKGKILEMDGKHFVAVEDLAQSLRGTIAYGEGQITLTLPESLPATVQQSSPQPPSVSVQPPSSQPPSMNIQAPQLGRINGTLTYFFDIHTGNKADAGSKVWLVKGHVEIPADQTFVGTSAALGVGGNPEQYPAIQYSIANEKGDFEFRDVPPGQYTIVMQSAHTVGTLHEKRNFFGRGNGDTPRDSKGRVEFRHIQLKPGDTVDASKDFGPKL